MMENNSAPTWHDFLNDLFEGDQTLITEVQRIFGHGVRRQMESGSNRPPEAS